MVIMIVGKINSSRTITDFGVGAILKDIHQNPLCTTDLLRNYNFQFETEQTSRISQDWTKLIHGNCGASGLSGDSI